MLRIGLITLGLLLPLNVAAKDLDYTNIRSVESESTDLFEVLTQLSSANQALASRDYVSARRGFESVLLHDPSLPTARNGLRRTLIALGQLENAAALIDNENSADAVLIRVLSGHSVDPVVELTQALNVYNDPRLWNTLGRIHDAAGRYDLARNAYGMADFAGQRPGLMFNNIGQSFWQAGDIDEALVAFTKALAADPMDIRFDNNRRRALVAIGNIEDAVARLSPARASAFLAQAGDQARTEGELRLAALLYKKSMDLSPRHNPQVAERLADLEQ